MEKNQEPTIVIDKNQIGKDMQSIIKYLPVFISFAGTKIDSIVDKGIESAVDYFAQKVAQHIVTIEKQNKNPENTCLATM